MSLLYRIYDAYGKCVCSYDYGYRWIRCEVSVEAVRVSGDSFIVGKYFLDHDGISVLSRTAITKYNMEAKKYGSKNISFLHGRS